MIRFVQLYEEHNCLWNMHMLLYQNKQVWESTVKEIITNMILVDSGKDSVKERLKVAWNTFPQVTNTCLPMKKASK